MISSLIKHLEMGWIAAGVLLHTVCSGLCPSPRHFPTASRAGSNPQPRRAFLVTPPLGKRAERPPIKKAPVALPETNPKKPKRFILKTTSGTQVYPSSWGYSPKSIHADYVPETTSSYYSDYAPNWVFPTNYVLVGNTGKEGDSPTVWGANAQARERIWQPSFTVEGTQKVITPENDRKTRPRLPGYSEPFYFWRTWPTQTSEGRYRLLGNAWGAQ